MSEPVNRPSREQIERVSLEECRAILLDGSWVAFATVRRIIQSYRAVLDVCDSLRKQADQLAEALKKARYHLPTSIQVEICDAALAQYAARESK